MRCALAAGVSTFHTRQHIPRSSENDFTLRSPMRTSALPASSRGAVPHEGSKLYSA